MTLIHILAGSSSKLWVNKPPTPAQQDGGLWRVA